MTSAGTGATIRTQLTVPLRFADGFTTTARVFTFDGLADGREHLAIGLGDRRRPASRDRHRWCGCTASASPATSSAASAATADPSCSRRSSGSTEAGGFLLYLRQEGRGIGLYAKLDAYALQDTGLDTYEANLALGYAEDERDYTVAAQMLHALGVSRVALLSNNPDKAAQLSGLGITVTAGAPRPCTSPPRTRATSRPRRGAARTRSTCPRGHCRGRSATRARTPRPTCPERPGKASARTRQKAG